jgi:hypothetical protein
MIAKRRDIRKLTNITTAAMPASELALGQVAIILDRKRPSALYLSEYPLPYAGCFEVACSPPSAWVGRNVCGDLCGLSQSSVQNVTLTPA